MKSPEQTRTQVYWRTTLRAIWSGLLTAFNSNKTSWVGLVLFLLVCLAAILAPMLAPYDPLEQSILYRLKPPTAEHLMGTDYYGRDTLSRLIWGARISLTIGLLAIGAAMIIGSLIGLVAGYFGGRTDIIIMQTMDVLLAFPSLILGLIVVAMLGPSITNLVIAISFTAIPPFARIARAPTMAIKEREFIEAGRALGYSDLRLMLGHILPNILPEILVMGSLWLATAIRVEASLAFIGLGVSPPTPTWGGMIADGRNYLRDAWWISFFPGLFIFLIVLALNFIGDWLRDKLDPRLRQSS